MKSVIISVGRNTDNDIVLNEGHISSHHAQLMMDENGKWFIHDLHSANGTFVNGIQITTPTEITGDDLVLLGGTLFQWNDFIEKYREPTQGKKTYKSYLYHYLLGLAAAIILFLAF